jgi:hypothetical protein
MLSGFLRIIYSSKKVFDSVLKNIDRKKYSMIDRSRIDLSLYGEIPPEKL